MARPGTVVSAIERAVDNWDPIDVVTVDHEIGPQDADVTLPAVVIQPQQSLRSNLWTTDLVGYETDANGNEIGRIYEGLFDMRVQVDVWTAGSQETSVDKLAHEVRMALYKYDDYMYDRKFTDEDGNTIDDIVNFTVDNGRRRDDVTTQHALRRYTFDCEASFVETVNTADEYGEEDYVADVVTPADGDWEGGDEEFIVFDASPNTDSLADDYGG